jgi:hypothetical protein
MFPLIPQRGASWFMVKRAERRKRSKTLARHSGRRTPGHDHGGMLPVPTQQWSGSWAACPRFQAEIGHPAFKLSVKPQRPGPVMMSSEKNAGSVTAQSLTAVQSGVAEP